MSLNPMFAATAVEQIGEIAHQFGVTWPLLISQIVLFVIVALVLKQFAYGPVLKMLDERKRRIAEGLESAEKMKAELAKAQAKAQEIMGQAGAQSNKIIEEARAAAARLTEQETQKAVAAATDIIAKARQANEAEFRRLENELKREIGRLSVQAAMRVTGKILTAEDQQRLADETNKQLAA